MPPKRTREETSTECPTTIFIDLQLHHDFVPMMYNAKFSDLTLEVRNVDGTTEIIPCHRVILAGASMHFDTLLSSNFEEGRTQRIVIEADEADAFKLFLQTVYKKVVITDHERILQVAQLYDKYSVTSGIISLHAAMRDKSIMATYLVAVPCFRLAAMEILTSQFLSLFYPTDADEVNAAAVALLDFDTLLQLVQSDLVVLRTEKQMLRVVLQWLSSRGALTNPSLPDAVGVERAGILLSGIRMELLSTTDLGVFQAMPWLNYPSLSERLHKKLLEGYRHRANVAEGRFRLFRSRQYILYDRTFAPSEKLFVGDCPEMELAGARFGVSFAYNDGKFGVYLKFHHKFDISIPIKFTVQSSSTIRCYEKKFPPSFDQQWGWRCIDSDLLFERREAPLRLFCVVAFSENIHASEAGA